MLLAGGAELVVLVTYTGNAIVSGDLNADGLINPADWTLFKRGQGANLSVASGLSLAQTYGVGDLNGDRKHDLADFSLFAPPMASRPSTRCWRVLNRRRCF